MFWIQSAIENPSKSEVIGRCGGDEKPNDHAETAKSRTLKQHSMNIAKVIRQCAVYSYTVYIRILLLWLVFVCCIVAK